MIKGHGDDAYQYPQIEMNFSSNICSHTDHSILMAHLASMPQLLGHYPEPEAWSLEAMIAERHNIDPRCVVVTSGATEAIYLIAQTFRYKPVIPKPSFSEYEDACRLFPPGIIAESSADPEEEASHNNIVWLCNPNNPTGRVYEQHYVEVTMATNAMLVLDHSYENYTNELLMWPRWGCRTPSSIQIHSFTKSYGIPGLRLGYITAHRKLTSAIRRFLRPWSVSALAIEAGKFLLQHDELACRPDLAEAQRLREHLSQIEGVEVMPTKTNFMLCRLDGNTAASLKDYLALEHKMLIRDASNFRGLTPQHFRVAAQTPLENDALVAAIQEFVKYSCTVRSDSC